MSYFIEKTLYISFLFSSLAHDKVLFQLLGISLKQNVHSRAEFFWVALCPVSPGILCSSILRHKLSAAPPDFCHSLELALRPETRSLRGTWVGGQLKTLQKQSGPSSWLGERPKTNSSLLRTRSRCGSGRSLCCLTKDLFADHLKDPHGEVFHHICKPKNWEGVANTCLRLVG